MRASRYESIRNAVRSSFEKMHDSMESERKLKLVFADARKQNPNVSVEELKFILDEMTLNGMIAQILSKAVGENNPRYDETIDIAIRSAAASGNPYAQLVIESRFLNRHSLA